MPRSTDQDGFFMFLDDYLEDAKEGLQAVNSALLSLEKDPGSRETLDGMFRAFHTLKSSSTMLRFTDVADLAHAAEDLLQMVRSGELDLDQEPIDTLFQAVDVLANLIASRAEGKAADAQEAHSLAARIGRLLRGGSSPGGPTEPAAKPTATSAVHKSQTVRVHVDVLDSLFDLAGEITIARNRIENLTSDGSDKPLRSALKRMHRLTDALQESVTAARLVPIAEVVQRLPRMVRDLAQQQHKEVNLVVKGDEIELDKGVLDSIGEPLLHLLRNAVAHGIEAPETRETNGKSRCGTITLSAERTENHVLIAVEDDGGGIDAGHLKDVFREKGVLGAEEAVGLHDKDLLDLLFRPGFSGAEAVSDLSGRGVGLDVVRTSVRELGGTVEVDTRKGEGTRFALTLPLTTAIMQTLMVDVGEHVFLVPADVASEAVQLDPDDLLDVQGERMLVLRKELIPFRWFADLVNLPIVTKQEAPTGLIVEISNKRFCVGVDAVTDQRESIVKALDPIARGSRGFSGGTVLDDGRVALVLDFPGLLESVAT